MILSESKSVFIRIAIHESVRKSRKFSGARSRGCGTAARSQPGTLGKDSRRPKARRAAAPRMGALRLVATLPRQFRLSSEIHILPV